MPPTRTLDPATLPWPDLHAYLLAAVAPRPIAFASTVDREGRVNLSPFSFFNVFSTNPPVMVFSPSRRGRDHSTKHTYDNILAVPETVINIVNFALAEQMSLASTEYAGGANEFVKAGLTEVPSDVVRPPRVGEAPVAFECVVDDVIPLGTQGGAGNLMLARVVRLHIQEAYLDEHGKLGPTSLDQVARMGGNWYCRAHGDALFEISKPLRVRGLGIDGLPESIRDSPILTGNNLGRLGTVEHLPDADAVAAMRDAPAVRAILEQFHDAPDACRDALHRLAQRDLEHGHVEKALRTLLVIDPLPA